MAVAILAYAIMFIICHASDDFEYFEWHQESLNIAKGSSLGTIDIKDNVYIEIDFILGENVFDSNERFTNIFHIGNQKEDRFPAIYTQSYSTSGYYVPAKSLMFRFTCVYGGSFTGNAAKNGYDNDYSGKPYMIPEVNLLYNIKINKTVNRFIITINDDIFYDEPWNAHYTYQNQQIYLSNPWNEAADVDILYLFIATSDDMLPFIKTESPNITGLWLSSLF